MRSELMPLMPNTTHDAGVRTGDTTVNVGTQPILIWAK
jgi:hypothetical protein